MPDALALYHRLKGKGKTKLFFEASERSIRYLSQCLGHENLTALEISDAGRFRDYLFNKGLSSSSVKRVFSSVRAVVNIAIKEHGLAGCDSAVVKVIVQTPIGQDVGHRHVRVLGPLFEFRSQ